MDYLKNLNEKQREAAMYTCLLYTSENRCETEKDGGQRECKPADGLVIAQVQTQCAD